MAKDLALVRALKKQRLTEVKFKETPIKDVIKWLRVATGKNFHVKQKALADESIELDDIVVNIELERIPVTTFLEVLLKPHGLAWVAKGNIIYITTKKDSYGKAVTRMYGISHITWTKVDFIAPEINLHPSNYTPVEEYEPEVVVENDPLNSGDAVAELIRELLHPKGWEENDDWTIRATDRYIVVRAPKSIHARIPRTLDMIAGMK